MTPVVWEHYERTPAYENMVSVLLSRLHPEAERIDGIGGDGGRDVQIRTANELHLFEIKSFTGRLSVKSPARRRQVEDSLKTAAAMQPDSWTLVVPINHNKEELDWFDSLRQEYPFPLTWFDRDWLDSQMAAFPDIRRYYIEGAADEVVALLRQLQHEGDPLIGGVKAALERAQALQGRLNEIDPQYCFELTPGPVQAAVAAHPGAVMYQEERHTGGDSWTISCHAKYRDAPNDRPITVKASLDFSGEGSTELQQQYIDLLLYGAGESVATPVTSLSVDAPGGLGATQSGGFVAIHPLHESIELPARLAVLSQHGIPRGSVALRFTRRAKGLEGATLSGEDITGMIDVQMQLHLSGTGRLNITTKPLRSYLPSQVLPALKLLAVLSAPNLMTVSIDNKPVFSPAPAPAGPMVAEGFPRFVEDLVHLQDATGTSFAVTADPTADDVRNLRWALNLIDGGEAAVTAPSTVPFPVATNSLNKAPTVGDLFEQLAFERLEYIDVLGEQVPLGMCNVTGGPWRVIAVESQEEVSRLTVELDDDGRVILKRGALTDLPPSPRGEWRLLMPRYGTTPDA